MGSSHRLPSKLACELEQQDGLKEKRKKHSARARRNQDPKDDRCESPGAMLRWKGIVILRGAYFGFPPNPFLMRCLWASESRWQRLYFFPLPHQHTSLRPKLSFLSACFWLLKRRSKIFMSTLPDFSFIDRLP